MKFKELTKIGGLYSLIDETFNFKFYPNECVINTYEDYISIVRDYYQLVTVSKKDGVLLLVEYKILYPSAEIVNLRPMHFFKFLCKDFLVYDSFRAHVSDIDKNLDIFSSVQPVR